MKRKIAKILIACMAVTTVFTFADLPAREADATAADAKKKVEEIQDQKDYRRLCVEKALDENGYKLEDVDVYVGRGGGLLPLIGGTYKVTDLLYDHASRGMTGQHPAQLPDPDSHADKVRRLQMHIDAAATARACL